jgi:hypothetical protein
MTGPVTARDQVADYLHRVERVCLDLPEASRRSLIVHLAEHLSEIDLSRASLDEQLGPPAQYAHELRAALDLPPSPTTPPLQPRRLTRRAVWALAVVVVLVAAATTVFIATRSSSGRHPQAINSLAGLPGETAVIQVGGGPVADRRWTLWAKISPTPQMARGGPNMPRVMFGAGLCTNLDLTLPPGTHSGVAGGSGPCLKQGRPASVSVTGLGPGSGFPARLFAGVVAKAVAKVRIEFIGTSPTIILNPVTTDRLPGISFFVTPVPTWHISSVAALNEHGNVIAVANPATLPTGGH